MNTAKQHAQRIAKITELSDQVFANPEKSKRWLTEPLKVLNGKSPIDMLDSEEGARLTLYKVWFVQQVAISAIRDYALCIQRRPHRTPDRWSYQPNRLKWVSVTCYRMDRSGPLERRIKF